MGCLSSQIIWHDSKDPGINCNLCFGYWLMQQLITTVAIPREDFPSRYSLFKSSQWLFFYWRQQYPVLTCLQSQLTNIHHLSPQVVKSNIKKGNLTSSQYYLPGRECKIQVTLSIDLSYFVFSLVRAELSEPIHSTFTEEGTWMGFKAVVNFLTSSVDLIACKYSHLIWPSLLTAKNISQGRQNVLISEEPGGMTVFTSWWLKNYFLIDGTTYCKLNPFCAAVGW